MVLLPCQCRQQPMVLATAKAQSRGAAAALARGLLLPVGHRQQEAGAAGAAPQQQRLGSRWLPGAGRCSSSFGSSCSSTCGVNSICSLRRSLLSSPS